MANATLRYQDFQDLRIYRMRTGFYQSPITSLNDHALYEHPQQV
jgi:hypothetical protein